MNSRTSERHSTPSAMVAELDRHFRGDQDHEAVLFGFARE